MNEIKIQDNEIHERRITATLDHNQIDIILLNAIAKIAGVKIDMATTGVRVTVSKVDKGSNGFRNQAKVEIVFMEIGCNNE